MYNLLLAVQEKITADVKPEAESNATVLFLFCFTQCFRRSRVALWRITVRVDDHRPTPGLVKT